MKLQVMLLLLVAAFLVAATFSKVRLTSPVVKEVYRDNNILEKKLLAIRCSPLYIPSPEDQIPKLTGWGDYSWKITTKSDSAQFYFDQGINMYYAFHIIESRASFDKATRLDPSCAMAWWGKALAFGPNINDFGYEAPSEAYPSATKAMDLKPGSSAVEKALIEAMAIRYSADTSKDQNALNELYRNEMKKVFEMYKSNADVAALYADALMILHPWDLYEHNYSPKPWTPEIVKVLKHTLQLSPTHPGANHYYIHAVEASAKPDDALKSAEILNKAMPEVSHITHMPSHIYIRTGYYDKGIQQNNKAVEGYEKYSQKFPSTSENIFLYSLHNLHMKASCAQLAGNYANALAASNELQQIIPASYLTIPNALGNYLQYLHQTLLFTQIRFGKWDDILKQKVEDSLSYAPVLQHFARSIAFAKLNQTDKASKELAEFRSKMTKPVLKEPLTPFNSAYDAIMVAEPMLMGVIAEQQKDLTSAIKHYQKAVELEDKLIYAEPRDWLLPARHYLGNALLKAGKHQQAEVVFKQDLFINPNNGWALTGLADTYKGMNKKTSTASARVRLKNAWIIKDVKIESPVF